MKIKWNEVTWYSRLGALLLFILIIPILTFYIGIQYEQVRSIQVGDQTDLPQSREDGDHINLNEGDVAESWGSIYGSVLLGPVCPVEMIPPDPDCEDRPYAAEFVATQIEQPQFVKRFSSDVQGKFNVMLPPAEYSIRLHNGETSLPYCSTPETVTVPLNDSVEVQIFCDSGIR